MTPEFLITLPKPGVQVLAPRETQENMALARQGKRVVWSDGEKARLRLMKSDGVLAKRYPSRDEGRKFVETEVDYEWREQLLRMAYELSDTIVASWKEIYPGKDVAVVLFGSVAKGLVKGPGHLDPSNIDVTVIGEFNESERSALFDAIRSKRNELEDGMKAHYPNMSPDSRGGNAGVHIQDRKKLENDRHSQTKCLIRSGATALHDPKGIWKELEEKALQDVANEMRREDERKMRNIRKQLAYKR